ncbi:MAG: hypothetical protein JRH20_21770 [Deltaproteobacteria bacterium]|nr:hypothetical protein [Deltaproteobacteria bacterium]
MQKSVYEGPERRQERSNHVDVALHHQLEQVASRRQIDALVLADADGRLWATSQESGQCSHAARAAASLPGDRHGFIQLVSQPDPITVLRLRLQEGQLFLVARASGDGIRRSRQGLVEAALGVERILRSLSN